MDCISEIRNLFLAFAERHSLTIEEVEEPNVELLMRVPAQPGLSFELTLCGQDYDIISIGFEEFWSLFFPFINVSQTVSDALDALATGDGRLVIYTQRGRVIKRVLQQRNKDDWHPIYTQSSGLRLPFVMTDLSYLYNKDARDYAKSQ